MSHFTVLVTKTNEEYNSVEEQLAPFDENRRMPRHITETKADFIAKGRKEVEYAKNKIAEYDKDPAAYESSTSIIGHIEWLNGEARQLAEITDDDELFKIGAEWYEDDLDADGNYWSETNEYAEWDWYQIGGRWAGFFIPKSGATGEKGEISLLMDDKKKVELANSNAVDVIKVKDIDWDAMDAAIKKDREKYFYEQMAKPIDNRFIWENNREELLKMSVEEYINQPISHATFAVLHNGMWYERGHMGWLGMVSDEKNEEQWDVEWRKLVESLDPETEVTVVDCHI